MNTVVDQNLSIVFVFRKNTFAWVTFMAEEKAEDKKYAILLR